MERRVARERLGGDEADRFAVVEHDRDRVGRLAQAVEDEIERIPWIDGHDVCEMGYHGPRWAPCLYTDRATG